ncbi:profilin-1-like protein, partial [Lates japonicus]
MSKRAAETGSGDAHFSFLSLTVGETRSGLSNSEDVRIRHNTHTLTAEEIRKLAGKRDTFGQCGPCVGGMKCRMLRDNMEDEKMYSLDLKSAADAEGNTYSVCVGKSKQALVIARGTKDATGGRSS